MASFLHLWATLLCFLRLELQVSARCDIVAVTDASSVNVSIGDALVVVSRSPWHLSVYDNASRKLVLDEVTDEEYRLRFGHWLGEYLPIYEGYLFRIGAVLEWYHAKEVINFTSTKDSASFLVSTSDKEGRMLRVDLLPAPSPRQFTLNVAVVGSKADESNRVAMGFTTPEDEGFYGFGERFNDVNQRGHIVGSWLEDGSWGLGVFAPDSSKFRVPKGELSTYCPMPLMISTKGYGLQMDTYYRTVFDLAKSKEEVMTLEQETHKLNLTVFLGRNPLETFLMQVAKNGRSLIPPPWEFSPWNQLGTEKAGESITDRAKQLLLDEDIPCSHGIDSVHFFPHGSQRGREEQLKQENKALLQLGIKNTAYFNAMLETGYTELYDVAARNGYFVKTATGQPYNFSYIGASTFYVSQMDYTNPAAVKWYQEQLQVAVDLGFHGWMYDYGEYTPPDSISSDGTVGLEMHNKFPLLYQKTAFDFFMRFDHNTSDAYAPDYLFYVRSSYTASQSYTWAQWTGDPSSDWSFASGLPAQITASLNIGLSGMPFSGSDIGGFEWYVDVPPTLELWARWTQAGCFSGLMHEQGRLGELMVGLRAMDGPEPFMVKEMPGLCGGGKGFTSKTHIFDWPEGTAIWRKYAKLRMQLFPYIYTQAHTAHETGLPIMRQHILHFPNDTTAIQQAQQSFDNGHDWSQIVSRLEQRFTWSFKRCQIW